MKKYLAFALSFLMAAAALTACDRGTVSEDPGGRITAPTGHSEPINPIPTMTIPPSQEAPASPSVPHGF